MRLKVFLLFAAGFFCFFGGNSSDAQGVFRVVEKESRIEVKDNRANVFLVVENPGEEFLAEVKLEAIAPGDDVQAVEKIERRIERGKKIVQIPLTLNQAAARDERLMWYRLRYEISGATSPKIEGIVSFSEMLPEVFELKMLASGALEEKIYRVRAQAVSPATQKPVAGVALEGEIKIEDDDDDKIRKVSAKAKTDAEGFAFLEFNMPRFGMGDALELKIVGRKDGLTRQVSDDVRNLAAKFVHVQTDKPMYQPNQTVNLRLHYLKLDNRPLKDEELTVEIEDEEDDEETIFTQKVKTSRFGISSVSWKIPEGVKLGNYQIKVSDNTENEVGYERIKITRYDLPNFSVEAKPDKSFYLPNDARARIEVGGAYLFGKPLEKAKIRITPRRERYESEPLMPEIEGELDASGKFTAEIDLTQAFKNFEPDSLRPFKDLHFSAFVTDLTTNRTEQRSFDVRITNEPIHVYLIGDTSNQSRHMPLKLYVSTFYADGREAVCDVAVYESVEKQPDDMTVLREIGKQLARIKTNSYGVARLDLPVELPENEDEIKLKIVAFDKAGKSGTLEREVDTEKRQSLRVETDKIAYRKGENVKISIVSGKRSGTIFVDVVSEFQLLRAMQARLENGRAEIVLPFQKDFQNSLTIAAHFEDETDENDLIIDSKTVVFPTADYLEIEADTKKTLFRPGEELTVKFRSRRQKKGLETALGILVLDSAIEERARSESELNDENAFLNRNFINRFGSLTGSRKIFGSLSTNDIKNLNPSRINADLALALEIALRDDRYEPVAAKSQALRDDVENAFSPYFRLKISPLATALSKTWTEKRISPSDEDSLREILRAEKIDFDNLNDAWGSRFRTEFRVEKNSRIMEIWSVGADKTPKTPDDLTVYETRWQYFEPLGRLIDSAMLAYAQRTSGAVSDYQTLRGELLKQNINLDALRDAFGNPYRFEFTVNSNYYILTVMSNGADGRNVQIGNLPSDDFTVWTNRTDYFTAARANLIKKFGEHVDKNAFPKDESEMRDILRRIDFNLDAQKDAFGRAFYVERREYAYPANVYRYTDSVCKVIRRKILSFAVKSTGRDGVSGNFDDFEMASFSGATIDEELEANSAVKCYSDEGVKIFSGEGVKIFRQKTVVTPNGAIGGTIVDPNGAVVPDATVTVENASGSIRRTAASNEEGYFLIDNLPKDVYRLHVSATGFKTTSLWELKIEASVFIEVVAVLEVGASTTTVEVTGSREAIVNTTSSMTSTKTVIGKAMEIISRNQPSFTPRVRDYFAETLVWSPELVTDKKGNARLKFKFADSLTTWKLYAVGSNENGEFGVVEKEFQTFQPFFAELDPPRILTEGDEIALPVPIRNYTARRQRVSVSMAKNDWSSLAEAGTQQIDVAANSTKNAIFNFRAATPVTDGKQKVTALAKGEGDAIEKSVTVKPNGRETIDAQSKIIRSEAGFDVNFPAESFPNTRRAEVKIYPNMLSHVAESVHGLLQRPYGCGEQTTSSTYPNLLILKIGKELKKPIDARVKTQAQIYLQEGYKRLLNYQTDSGGFSFWGKSDAPNVALTAYVLRFLTDAEDFIPVDETVVDRAEEWLLEQQKADGSWDSSRANADVSTAYAARALSLTTGKNSPALQSAVGYLKKRLPEIKDDYVLAILGLTALETGDAETARDAIEKLTGKDASSWTTDNTPFNGWGKTAEIETTALVVQLLVENSGKGGKAHEDLISKGVTFLLKNKDRYGVWYSTQTTVNVLDTLILLQTTIASGERNAQKAEIFVNGKKAQEFTVSNEGLSQPFVFDASAFLSGNENRVEIKGLSEQNLTMAQIVAAYYTNWKLAKTDDARWFDLQIDFDKTQANVGEDVFCSVTLQSKTKRYGMILAEIGLPPGADVDRANLEKARLGGVFSSYDVLPDKIVIYLWADLSPTKFSFKFRPRFGLNAQTAPSLVYDYYNEEARATIAPTRFFVK